ncbi:hypothetical protein [Streptomyces sp. SID1121]|uniref:hypothetical protein n=1 Tax=Streptomyces sp. SID1121 TaxID=3425888 RepID=UPI004056BD85
MEDPAGAGRPEIGNPVHVRLGHLVHAVDDWATERDVNRAEAVRRLVSNGLEVWPKSASSLPDEFECIASTGDVEAAVQVWYDGESYAITLVETGDVLGITREPLVAAAIEGTGFLGYEPITITELGELRDGEEDAVAYPHLVERGREILANLLKRAVELLSMTQLSWDEQEQLVVELTTDIGSLTEGQFERRYKRLDKALQQDVDQAIREFADNAVGSDDWD